MRLVVGEIFGCFFRAKKCYFVLNLRGDITLYAGIHDKKLKNSPIPNDILVKPTALSFWVPPYQRTFFGRVDSSTFLFMVFFCLGLTIFFRTDAGDRVYKYGKNDQFCILKFNAIKLFLDFCLHTFFCTASMLHRVLYTIHRGAWEPPTLQTECLVPLASFFCSYLIYLRM